MNRIEGDHPEIRHELDIIITCLEEQTHGLTDQQFPALGLRWRDLSIAAFLIREARSAFGSPDGIIKIFDEIKCIPLEFLSEKCGEILQKLSRYEQAGYDELDMKRIYCAKTLIYRAQNLIDATVMDDDQYVRVIVFKMPKEEEEDYD